MLRFLFTILLNLIGIGFLVLMIIVPSRPEFRNDKRVDSLLGKVLCNSNERLVRQPSNNPLLRNTPINITPYCVGRNGQQTDVSTRWLLIGFGGFGVTILFGIVLDIMLLLNGFRRLVMRLSIRRNKLASFSTTPSILPSPDLELSLNEKLMRLDATRKSGAISDAEYKQMRQDILDKLTGD